VQLQINNLFSYKNASIHLESYNVIVGANASGKTNMIRILGFLRSDTAQADDRRLPLDLKFDKNLPSSLRIDILLTKYEAKILLELIFNKKIEDYLFDEIVKIYGFNNYSELQLARNIPHLYQRIQM